MRKCTWWMWPLAPNSRMAAGMSSPLPSGPVISEKVPTQNRMPAWVSPPARSMASRNASVLRKMRATPWSRAVAP